MPEEIAEAVDGVPPLVIGGLEPTYRKYSERLAIERIRLLAPVGGVAFIFMQLRVPLLFPDLSRGDQIATATGRLLTAVFLIFAASRAVELPPVRRHLRLWIALFFAFSFLGQSHWIAVTGGIDSPSFAYFAVLLTGWMIASPGGIRDNWYFAAGFVLLHFAAVALETGLGFGDLRLYQRLNYLPELVALALACMHILERHRREEYESKRLVFQQNEILSHSAYFDSLTAIGNRRFFDERLREQFETARRYQRPLSLLMLDVDRFKEVNDRLGHQAGDQLLRQFAGIVRAHVRSGDVIARYGGDEFVVILPETNIAGAKLLAERIRQKTEQTPLSVAGERVRVTTSIGAVELTDSTVDGEQFLELADQELYRAKRGGRNRVN